EGKTGQFEIFDFEPDVVEAAIQFLYEGTLSYKAYAPLTPPGDEPESKRLKASGNDECSLASQWDATTNSTDHLAQLFFHARVSALADFLQLGTLRAHANSRIRIALQTSWPDLSPGFPDFIRFCFETNGDPELRSIANAAVEAHLPELSQRDDFRELPMSYFIDAYAACVKRCEQLVPLEAEIPRLERHKETLKKRCDELWRIKAFLSQSEFCQHCNKAMDWINEDAESRALHVECSACHALQDMNLLPEQCYYCDEVLEKALQE
ncbi:hypothetical protein KEM55_001790, partial [Ascosphaera atra]